MILPDSRYASGTLSVVDDPVRGSHQALNPAPPTEKIIQFTFYQVAVDDTIDMLAYQFMGKGQYWWMIADANPEILDWNNIPVGTIIRIPYA
jgi:phage tail protein X